MLDRIKKINWNKRIFVKPGFWGGLLMIFFLLWHSDRCIAQVTYYQDVFHGGVTGNGSVCFFCSDTLRFDVDIPSGSTIRKAFLISARDSLADDITVKLNGISYTFSDATIVTGGFISYILDSAILLSNSSIHSIDITGDIDPFTSQYILFQPPQPNFSKGTYSFFYLYIAFDNPDFPTVCTSLFLNKKNVASVTDYHLTGMMPFNNIYPVGLEAMTTYFCDTINDGSIIRVNGNYIGQIGGSDITNSGSCTGPFPNFAYYNRTLFGLADDIADSLMGGSDATADIKSYVNLWDTDLDVRFIYADPSFGPYTNPIRALALNYVSPCDTFTTHLLTSDTVICQGESVQLGASGGTAYNWQPEKNLSCYDCADPVFSGDSTQVYTVRIFNGDSCSKVLPVRVLVPQPPEPVISITDAFCDPYNGVVKMTQPDGDQFILENDTNTSGTFYNLMSGDFSVKVIDSFGCSWEGVVTVGVNSPAQAAFTVSPDSGYSPLTVNLIHEGSGANTITWQTAGMEATGTTAQLTFQDSGTYSLAEIACWNEYPCCDTAYATITVFPGIDVIVPNIITPNNDGRNDNLVARVAGVASMKWQVFNRWGNLITSGEATDPAESVVMWIPGEGQFSAGVYTVVMRIAGKSGEVRKMVVQVMVNNE